MPSLRDIRRKIKSIKSTQQITKAMKMVSAARMRRAQSDIVAARPFALKMGEMVSDIAAAELCGGERVAESVIHPFFHRKDFPNVGLVLVSSDKGLCGSFNANLARVAAGWLKANQGRNVCAFAVGRKGREFFQRLKGFPLDFVFDLAGIFPKVKFAHAELLGKAVIDAYNGRNMSGVTAVFNEFVSVGVQRVNTLELLPVSLPSVSPKFIPLSEEFFFEPDRKMLLDSLLPRYMKARLYRILLESQAAELAARMNAMDAASRNAGEILEHMTLVLNRTRQYMITREIAELVGGAEALREGVGGG